MTAKEAREIISVKLSKTVYREVDSIVKSIEAYVEMQHEVLYYSYRGNHVDEVCSELKKLGYNVKQSYINYDKTNLEITW